MIQFKQRDRNLLLKNMEYEETMNGLIRQLKSRDTKGNVRKLMIELEKWDPMALKRSTSMFKIKQFAAE